MTYVINYDVPNMRKTMDREFLQKIQRLIKKDIPFFPLKGAPQQHFSAPAGPIQSLTQQHLREKEI